MGQDLFFSRWFSPRCFVLLQNLVQGPFSVSWVHVQQPQWYPSPRSRREANAIISKQGPQIAPENERCSHGEIWAAPEFAETCDSLPLVQLILSWAALVDWPPLPVLIFLVVFCSSVVTLLANQCSPQIDDDREEIGSSSWFFLMVLY